tara:strand:- start:4 stop:420 length:417 start_codon:yes stop_codon:yes gene_type:complete
MRRKYDLELMNQINLFEKITRIRPKDCVVFGDNMFFLVDKSAIKMAVGRQGTNVRQLEKVLSKRVKVMSHADKPVDLAKNFVFPARPVFVKLANNVIEIKFKSTINRRYLLDNTQEKLRLLEKLVSYYWPEVKSIKIL